MLLSSLFSSPHTLALFKDDTIACSDLADEYELIMAKKSELSSNDRAYIVRIVEARRTARWKDRSKICVVEDFEKGEDVPSCVNTVLRGRPGYIESFNRSCVNGRHILKIVAWELMNSECLTHYPGIAIRDLPDKYEHNKKESDGLH